MLAYIRTALHELSIGRQLAAAFAATAADLGAQTAQLRSELRAAAHEACSQIADLGAVVHRGQMSGIGVFAAHLQAHGRRLGTDLVAL